LEVEMEQTESMRSELSQTVLIPLGRLNVVGELTLPVLAPGVVLFAHGSGSSRYSPRNQFVARRIRTAGVGTLLFDLLTREEELLDLRTGQLRFDTEFLARRLLDATEWIERRSDTGRLRIGYFGASTGAGAALIAAANAGERIGAVVSRGGRPDLAWSALPHVESPALLIVGGLDEPVIRFNQAAYARLRCEKELKIVPGASHLFEEGDALAQVADLAADWFRRHLTPQAMNRSAKS
jgi:dienelactone hydrolase